MAEKKRWTFKCSGCKKEHEYGSYAIAQLAQGVELVFTCDCNAKTILTKRKMQGDKKRAEAAS